MVQGRINALPNQQCAAEIGVGIVNHTTHSLYAVCDCKHIAQTSAAYVIARTLTISDFALYNDSVEYPNNL